MRNVKFMFSWVIVVGLASAVAALFSWSVDRAFLHFMDQSQPWPLLLLPVAGLATFGMYRLFHLRFSTSTAAVVKGIRDRRTPSILLAPAIFIGTCLTIICGGSVGKEAAVLQMGPALACIPEKLHLAKKEDGLCLAACGMAAGTGVLFGTPIAGFLLVCPIVYKTVNKPHELLGEFAGALVGALVGISLGIDLKSGLGIDPGGFVQGFQTMPLTPENFALVLALALLTLMLGVAFTEILLKGRSLINLLFSRRGNKHLKPIHVVVTLLAAGIIYSAVVYFLNDVYVFGTGSSCILFSLYNDDYFGYTFVAKFFLTALLLIGGFKGGEIMPMLAIGAAFGSFFASHFGGDAMFFASLAMIMMFGTCTGCPFAALAMGLEIFGFANAGWFVFVLLFPLIFTRKIGLYGRRHIFAVYDA